MGNVRLRDAVGPWAFRSRTVAKFSYPILRAGRNLALKVLGRSQLQPRLDR
jgi:hypothetical protein